MMVEANNVSEWPEKYKEELEILEETLGELNEREKYVFKMAKDFEVIDWENFGE